MKRVCLLLFVAIIVLAAGGVGNKGSERVEAKENGAFKEIKVSTATPKPTPAVNFDLGNLSCVCTPEEAREGKERKIREEDDDSVVVDGSDQGAYEDQGESGKDYYIPDDEGESFSGSSSGETLSERVLCGNDSGNDSGSGSLSELDEQEVETTGGTENADNAGTGIAFASADSDPEGIPETGGILPEGQEDNQEDHPGKGEGIVCLGTWTITFYCACPICCGEWATGCTASGVLAQEWHTVAAGEQFEFGTEVFIDGLGWFTVEDRGVEGDHIDVFVSDHQEALNLGLQYRDVYLLEG